MCSRHSSVLLNMKTTLDSHEQPYEAQVNRARRTERDLLEMLGLAKGMLADGVVNEDEARALRGWGTNHSETLERWPLNLIFTRLNQYFADGRIDESERAELHDLRRALVASGE
jgi:hypothetical protein